MERKTLKEKNKNCRKGRISGKKTLLLLCLLPCLLFGCAKAPGINTEGEESQGDKLLEAGSYQEAADLYQQKIDGGEGSEENYRRLGIAWMGLGDYNKAAAAFETALSEAGIVPGDTEYDINYYLGSCYDKLGDYEAALKVYDAIVTLRPKDADAIELRGAVKMQMGDTDGMQEDFSKSIALEPSNYDRLLSVYSAMSQNGYDTEGKVGIAYTLQIVGQKGADPAIASLIMSLESVISAVSAFLILHQTMSGRELFGCVLMASAIVLVQMPELHPGRKRAETGETGETGKTKDGTQNA